MRCVRVSKCIAVSMPQVLVAFLWQSWKHIFQITKLAKISLEISVWKYFGINELQLQCLATLHPQERSEQALSVRNEGQHLVATHLTAPTLAAKQSDSVSWEEQRQLKHPNYLSSRNTSNINTKERSFTQVCGPAKPCASNFTVHRGDAYLTLIVLGFWIHRRFCTWTKLAGLLQRKGAFRRLPNNCNLQWATSLSAAMHAPNLVPEDSHGSK